MNVSKIIRHWKYQQGYSEIQANFNDSVKQLRVTNYQLVILFWFTELQMDQLQVKLIQEESQIELKTLIYQIWYLRHAGIVSSDTEKITEDSVITLIVEKHNNKNKRLNSICYERLSILSSDTIKRRQGDIIEMRKNDIKIQLVRIMKSKRALELGQLISEAKNAIKTCQTDEKFVKRVFEELINENILERDANNEHLILYIS